MRWRTAAAWAGIVLGVLLVAAGLVLAARRGERLSDAAFPLAMLGFIVAGGVVALRRPSHPVGWLLGGWGLSSAASQAAVVYADLATPAQWPLADVAGWYGVWGWAPGLPLLGLALLRFPDGHLPSRRWVWPQHAALAGLAALAVVAVLLWPDRGPALTGLSDPGQHDGIAGAISGWSWWLLVLPLPAGIVALVVRYRRSDATVRAQLRWILLPAILIVSGVAGFALTGAPGHDAHPLAEALALLGFLGIPIAIAVAILRYRLFEIDRLLSRTVSYALLTGLLLGVYGGAVLLLGRILSPFGGDVTVAASTLLVAALFRPLRRRVQSAVDRRFNRSRYDASRTVADFAAALRHELDIDGLCAELERTITRSVDPAAAGVWLRDMPTATLRRSDDQEPTALGALR